MELLEQYWTVIAAIAGAIIYIIRLEGKIKLVKREREICKTQCDAQIQSISVSSGNAARELNDKIDKIDKSVENIDKLLEKLISFFQGQGVKFPSSFDKQL
jgi:hypothetical protein